ncbi:MAG: NAD(P)H-dependent oxidoreductase [Flavobacteriia bacterium]|nr:NAD(P)H-dependent oxidoreductase [Flavobacteriia bacterium]
MQNSLLDALNWRYATKRYDASRKIPQATFELLMESIRLTPSSYGMQSYGMQPIKILNIENQELREKIKPIAWNQQQVVDSSHLLVFCYQTNPGEQEVKEHVERMATTRQKPVESLEGFQNHVIQALEGMGEEKRAIWTSKQTYIALGQLLLSCALEKIDATPMEGFDAQALNELLELPKQGFQASLLCPMGYRHLEDPYASLQKIRKSSQDLFITI